MEIERSLSFRLEKLSHFFHLPWSVYYETVLSTMTTCKPGHGRAFLHELKNEIVIGQNSAVVFQSWQLYVTLSAN
jgi:hypothetical protein